MKANQEQKVLTFGEFIARIYDTCGRKTAEGIVRSPSMRTPLSFEDMIALRF